MMLCGGVCIFLVIAMFVLRRKSIWQKIRSPCRVLLAFGVMGCMAQMMELQSSEGISSGRIARNAPGGGVLEVDAVFSLPQEDTEYPITLAIEEQKYHKSEEQKRIADAVKEIDATFCGYNASLEEIISDPVVSDSYQDGAVLAEWMFSDEKIISEDGRICQSALKKSRQEIEAFVVLSCGESEETHRFSFWIVPEEKSQKEQAILKIEEEIELQDETKEFVSLPQNIDGKKIEWKEAPSAQPAEFLGLGILAAIAASYAQKEEKEKKIQKRKRRLLLSYPEFAGKLSLLLGAGMSISGAVRKINQMYQKRRSEGGETDPVYEELHQMICEMDNGMSEIKAYQAFSERCDLQPYRKLVSLLISGQKVGNRRLREQLDEEVDRVFLERKQTARKLGEEAGTKMLLPMMMMLIIVMGIVIIPAFLSIYGT